MFSISTSHFNILGDQLLNVVLSYIQISQYQNIIEIIITNTTQVEIQSRIMKDFDFIDFMWVEIADSYDVLLLHDEIWEHYKKLITNRVTY